MPKVIFFDFDGYVTNTVEVPESFELIVDPAGAAIVPDDTNLNDVKDRHFDTETKAFGEKRQSLRKVSRLEFARLFTQSQFLQLDALEVANDPTVRYFMGLMRLAEYVDLTDPIVSGGLQLISSQHPDVLPAAEVSRILSGQYPATE